MRRLTCYIQAIAAFQGVMLRAADAWIDGEKTKAGYEIPFNRHFYVFKPPRELAELLVHATTTKPTGPLVPD